MEAIRSKPSNLGLLCFLGLNIVDSVITWRGLAAGALEANWYAFLFSSMPVWAVLILKMAIVGLVALFVYRYKPSLFKFLNIGMTLVVIFNLFSLVITRAMG